MAIRDTFRRALRRSDSSATSSHNESSKGSTATSTAESENTSLHKTSSRLTTWSWSSNAKEKDKEPRERKPKNKTRTKRPVTHPSQRPLTAQNLAHQEMLSHFTMTFGTTRPEQIETASFIGISPCCTRAPSLVGDSSDDDYSPNSSGSSTPRLSDGGR